MYNLQTFILQYIFPFFLQISDFLINVDATLKIKLVEKPSPLASPTIDSCALQDVAYIEISISLANKIRLYTQNKNLYRETTSLDYLLSSDYF